MGRFRFRSYFDDALFVVLIMAAAMAAAAMEASAVLGAFRAAADHPQLAKAAPSKTAPVIAAASSVEGAPVSVAAARIARPAR